MNECIMYLIYPYCFKYVCTWLRIRAGLIINVSEIKTGRVTMKTGLSCWLVFFFSCHLTLSLLCSQLFSDWASENFKLLTQIASVLKKKSTFLVYMYFIILWDLCLFRN